MQLIPLGANKTEIVFGDRTVFFSYKTPVAMHIRGLVGRSFVTGRTRSATR